jgi:hypothetical protein
MPAGREEAIEEGTTYYHPKDAVALPERLLAKQG